jgi:LPPG:FO 2-phospho-L-lactate transferase
MMRVSGHSADALGVSEYYSGLIDGIVIDTVDAPLAAAIRASGVQVKISETVMQSDADRARLASEMMEFAAALR